MKKKKKKLKPAKPSSARASLPDSAAPSAAGKSANSATLKQQEDQQIALIVSLLQEGQLPHFDALITDYLIGVLNTSISLILSAYANSPYFKEIRTDQKTRDSFKKLIYAYLYLLKLQPSFSSGLLNDLQAILTNIPTFEFIVEQAKCPEKHIESVNCANFELFLRLYAEYLFFQPDHVSLIKELIASSCLLSIDFSKSEKSTTNIAHLFYLLATVDGTRFLKMIPELHDFISQQNACQNLTAVWLYFIRLLILDDIPEIEQICEVLYSLCDLSYCGYLLHIYSAITMLGDIDLYQFFISKTSQLAPETSRDYLIALLSICVIRKSIVTLEIFIQRYSENNDSIMPILQLLSDILLPKQPYMNLPVKQFLYEIAACIPISSDGIHSNFPMLLKLAMHLVGIKVLHPFFMLIQDHSGILKQFFLNSSEILNNQLNFSAVFNSYTKILNKKRGSFKFFSQLSIAPMNLETASFFDIRLGFMLTEKSFPVSLHFSINHNFKELVNELLEDEVPMAVHFWEKIILSFYDDKNTLSFLKKGILFDLSLPTVDHYLRLCFDLYLRYGTKDLEMFIQATLNDLSVRVKFEKDKPIIDRTITGWLLRLSEEIRKKQRDFSDIIKDTDMCHRYETLIELFFSNVDLISSLKLHEILNLITVQQRLKQKGAKSAKATVFVEMPTEASQKSLSLSQPAHDSNAQRLPNLQHSLLSEFLPPFDDLITQYDIETIEDTISALHDDMYIIIYSDTQKYLLKRLCYAYLFHIQKNYRYTPKKLKKMLDSINETRQLFQGTDKEEEIDIFLYYLIDQLNSPLEPIVTNTFSKQGYAYFRSYIEHLFFQPDYQSRITAVLTDPIQIENFLVDEANTYNLMAVLALADCHRFIQMIPQLNSLLLTHAIPLHLSWGKILKQLLFLDFHEMDELCDYQTQFGPRTEQRLTVLNSVPELLNDCRYLHTLSRYTASQSNMFDLYDIYHQYSGKTVCNYELLALFRIAATKNLFIQLENFLSHYYGKADELKKQFFFFQEALIFKNKTTTKTKTFIRKLILELSSKNTLFCLQHFLIFLINQEKLNPTMALIYDHNGYIRQLFKENNIHLSVPIYHVNKELLKKNTFHLFGKEIFFNESHASIIDFRLIHFLQNDLRNIYFYTSDTFCDYFTKYLSQYKPEFDCWEKIVLIFGNELGDNSLHHLYPLFRSHAFYGAALDRWLYLALDLYVEYGCSHIKVFLEDSFAHLSLLIETEKILPKQEQVLCLWSTRLKARFKAIKPQLRTKIPDLKERSRYLTLQNLVSALPDLQALIEPSVEHSTEPSLDIERILQSIGGECPLEKPKKNLPEKKTGPAKKRNKEKKDSPHVMPTPLSTPSPKPRQKKSPAPLLLHQYHAKTQVLLPKAPPARSEKNEIPHPDHKIYRFLAGALKHIRQYSLASTHPYAQIAHKLDTGLKLALRALNTEASALAALYAHDISPDMAEISDPHALTWFLALDEKLRRLSKSEPNTELLSILKGEADTLYLPADLNILKQEPALSAKAVAIQALHQMAAQIYQNNPRSVQLSLYGSTSRAWFERAITRSKKTNPHDLDFSLQAQAADWQIADWFLLIEASPDLTLVKKPAQAPNPAQDTFYQMTLNFAGTEEIDLNFHVAAPPVLGSFSVRVILALDETIPRFQLAEDAVLHFPREKIVINETCLQEFLDPKRLAFLIKELCLRTYEGWRVSGSTLKLLGEQLQQLPAADLDLGIRIFLSKYLQKNPIEFLHYFHQADEAYHVLYIWMQDFKVPLNQMRRLRSDMDSLAKELSEENSLSQAKALDKCRVVLNDYFHTLIKTAITSEPLYERFTGITLDLHRRIKTGHPNLFKHQCEAQRTRPRIKA